MAATQKKTVTKRPPRTLKERKFVKALATSKSATEAAAVAGYKDPGQAAYENMKKLEMGYHFHKAGLTNEVIAQNTARIALTATKVVGTANDFVEVEDNPTKLHAMKFAAELIGLTKSAGDVTVVNVQPILSSLDVHRDDGNQKDS